MRLCVAIVVCGVLAANVPAGAREPLTAIAPITSFGPNVPPELQGALLNELPNALTSVGFVVRPQAEIDLLVRDRPDFLKCRAGICLADEALYLKVDQLAVPRLERNADGSFAVGVALYDGGDRRVTVEASASARGTPADVRDKLYGIAKQLAAKALPNGRLEVVTRPSAALTIDGGARGMTPWSGELPNGEHTLVLESEGARTSRTVSVASGKTARVELTLQAAPPPPPPPPRRDLLRPFKWVTLVGGVLAVGAGATLIGLDGHGTCSTSGHQCPQVFDTLIPGAAVTAVGGALLVTSVVLFIYDRPKRH